ncbi:MAG: LysM peptidoglycan-binding domain-containing protein [Parahaliea sp.]
MTTLTGCQHLNPVEQSPPEAVAATKIVGEAHHTDTTAQTRLVKHKSSAAQKSASEAALAPDNLWQQLRNDFSWPLPDRPSVAAARKHYLRQPTYLEVISERSSLYLYYIAERVAARGLPAEIALLPMVESTMNPFARSSGHAAGLWQIMPATGRHLGLASNWWYEGRMDLRQSTEAALDYLESLHEIFDGDWLLALAAYNSGQGRVRRAVQSNLKRGKAADFWSLSLPAETRSYVPRLMALASIIATPEKYGATLPPVPNRPAFGIADTGGQIDINRAAGLAGIDEATLRALNPGQLQWATAPGQAQELLLPTASIEHFKQALSQLPASERVAWQRYRIRRGDSLNAIAHRFDTEVAAIREANNLKGHLIRAGDTLLIPRGGGAGYMSALNPGGMAKSRNYRVKRGDSLYRIASRFRVTVEDIISWNALNPRDYIRPGQKLTLYVRGGG